MSTAYDKHLQEEDEMSDGLATKGKGCVVCGGYASHNIGGIALVCTRCCPGCGKVGQEREQAKMRFDLAVSIAQEEIAADGRIDEQHEFSTTLQQIRELDRAPLLRIIDEMHQEIETLKERLSMLQDMISRTAR